MRWLDASTVVESWMYEPLTVEYVASERLGRIRQYTPDFLIEWADGTVELVEIKPDRRINKRVISKAEAAASLAHETGACFSVVTERELKQMGVM